MLFLPPTTYNPHPQKKSRALVRRPAEEHPEVARRMPPGVVEQLIRLGVRHARGRPLPNQKHDSAPTSAEAPSLQHSAWPNGNTLAPTRSEYRLCNPKAKDFQALPGPESVQCGTQPEAWRVPLRRPDRPER